jgi:hypothetical protein
MPFEIHPFTDDALYDALSNPNCPKSVVATLRPSTYLAGYLKDIHAKTLVVELDYVDGDFLDDFASYFVKCFFPYERKCKRLHLFSASITEATFKQLILGSLPERDRCNALDAYLGFVVVRPLPSAIVGRTLLKTYESDGGRRNYPCTKRYEAHLFGVELSVESLPYQEQDSVLAACATVSLWSCFHKTAELFGTATPTPATITRLANQALHTRSVPSHALNVFQMCRAVAENGLEPEVIEVKPGLPLVSLLYAHLRMGLPVVLLVHVERIGGHAITIVGYSMRSDQVHASEVAPGLGCVPMAGLMIDELYAHDDQIGPFSRLKITVGPPVRVGNVECPYKLTGSWTDKATGQVLSLYPLSALIPVYHKVRVTFIDVQEWITRLDAIVVRLFVAADRRWDVHLITSNEYKKHSGSTGVPVDELEQLLLQPFPRFIWRALLSIGNTAAIELVFDATDMSRSMPIFKVVWRHPGVRAALQSAARNPANRTSLEASLTAGFLDLLSA